MRGAVLRGCTSAAALGFVLAISGAVNAQTIELPSGGQVVAGSATIGTGPSQVTVDQTSSHAIVDWRSFSVGAGGTVAFNNGSGATLNRVTGGDLSTIAGQITSTGSVYLINPSGIVIDSGGKVLTGGSFVASTRMMDAASFLSGGDANFDGTSAGGIDNKGSITAGGDVVLIGKMVVNSGTINADGTAGLIAADHIVLHAPSANQRVTVDYGDGDVTNSGTISAASAELKAASGNVFALAGNSGGIISVVGTATQPGRIWLGASGNVTLSGVLAAKNADGSGGAVTVTGTKVTLADGALVDVSGSSGGTALLGGDYQGGNGDRRFGYETVAAATELLFARGATIRADATGVGNGGNVVLWSERSTEALGTITARGGAEGGDGGFVETSGHLYLDFQGNVSTTAAKGRTGTLLLDPTDITISAAASSVTGGTTGSAFTNATTTFSPGDRTSAVINTTDLQNAVAANSVIINTSGAGSGTGNITLSAALTLTGSNSLTLNAVGAFTSTSAGVVTLAANNLNINAATGITIGGIITKESGAASQINLTNSGSTSDIQIQNVIAIGQNSAATGLSLTLTANSSRDVLVNGSAGAFRLNNNAGANTNTLTANLNGRDITFDNTGTTTFAQISQAAAASTLSINANATRDITVNDGVTEAAATAPANRNTINLTFKADGNISFTGGSISGAGTWNANATDLRSRVNVDWRAGGGTGAAGNAISVSSTSAAAFDLRGGNLNFQTLTTGPVGAGATTGGNIMTAGTLITNGTITTGGGDITMTTAGGAISVNSALNSSQGSAGNNNLDAATINLTSASSVTLGNFGQITQSDSTSLTTLTAQNGAVTLGTASLVLQGSNLTVNATDTITLGGPVSTAGGAVNLTSTRNGAGAAITTTGTTLATGIATANGNVTMTANGTSAGISVGFINSVLGTITLDARGSVSQTGSLLTSAAAGGGLRLLGAGASYNLTLAGNALTGGATIAGNTGSIAYAQTASLSVGTVSGTAGITTTGQTQLSASGGIVSQSQAITSAGLLATGSGGVTLTNASNAVTGTTALSTTNTAISFTNTGNTTIGSVTGVGNIVSIAGLNAGTNTVTLTGTGTTSQTNGANIIAANLLLLGSGGIYQLSSTGNDVNTIAANTGRVQFVDTDDLATGVISGTNGITTTGTSSSLSDFTVDLTAGAGGGSQFLTITGTTGNIATGGNGNVKLVADKISLVGTINTTTAVSRKVQITTVTAGRGIDFGASTLDNADNTTLDLGNDEMARITSGITHIGSATAGTLRVLGTFNSPTNILSLETGAGVDQTGGAIIVNSGAGDLAIRGVGDINVATQNNQVAKVAINSAGGNVRFRDDNGFTLDDVDGITTSVVSPGGLLQLVTNATVAQNHSLTADNLRLGSAAATAGTYTLSNAANNFTTVAGRAASLNLTETGGFAVGTVDAIAGLTATTAATLSSTGAVTQTQIITTPSLTLNGTGGAFTLTGNNQVGAVGGNTGSIDFNNTLAAGLTVNATTVATTAKITANNGSTGNLVLGSAITSSASSGDSVVLATAANFVGTGGSINPGTGTARYLIFTNNSANTTEWTGTVRGTLTSNNFYNAPFDFSARSSVVGSPNLTSSFAGNAFVYADQPTLLYTIMATDSKSYNGLIQNLPSSYTSGLVNADTIGASATGAAGSTGQMAGVGTYTNVTGTIGTLASPINYAFSFTGTGIQTITPALLTINVGNKTKTYGDTDPAFTFTVTGLQNGEAVGTALNGAGTTYTANGAGGTNITNALTRTAGETVAGGPYAITTGAGLTATANYTIQTVNNGNLTITQRVATIAAVAKTKVYGDADPALTFTVGNLASGDTATSVTTGALTRVAGETVAGGPYQINQGTLALNSNYSFGGYTPANLTITAAPLQVSGTGTKVFGQADPVLTITSSGYKLSDTQGTVLTGALTRTPGETVAGSPYQVLQGTVLANSNYNLIYTPGTFTITQASISLTYSVANTTNVYGALPTVGTVTLTGVLGMDVVTPVITVRNSLNAPVTLATTTGVGTYTASVTGLGGADASNYMIAGTGNTNGTITVTPAPLTINVADKTKIYGDADPAFTFMVAGLQNGESIGTALNTAGGSYTATSTTGGTNITNALTRSGDNNVGGAKVITTGAGLTATSNYTIQTVNPGALTITKRDTTLAAVAKTKVYGDSDPALTFTVGNLAAGDTATGVTTGALTRAVGETVAGGPYAITQGTLALNGNYNLTGFTPSNLTITAAPLSVTASAATKVYGQADPALGFTATGFKLTDTAGTVLTGALARAAGETVAGGPYAIGQGTLAAGANYAVTFTGNALTITPAPLTINVADKSKTYGDADPALTFTVAGLVNGDAVGAALTGLGTTYTANGAGGTNLTNALTRGGDNNVGGAKPITTGAGLAATSNYSIQTVNNGALTIAKRDVTIAAVAKTKVYGDADPALTFTVGNLAAGDTVAAITTGSLARVAGEHVQPGPYQINQGTVTVSSGNYNLTGYTPANLTITPAPLAVSAVAASVVYGSPDPMLGFTSTGYKFTDTATDVLSGSVTRTAGLNVGNYPILQGTVVANPDYAINYTPANLSITPAPLLVTGTGTKIFGDPDPVLTPIATGLKYADTQAQVLTGALTRAPGESAGLYNILQGTVAANANYMLLYSPGTFTISPANISFSVSYAVANSTSVYGTLPTPGAVTFTGLQGNDVVTPVITVTNAQNAPIVLATNTGVGTYTATVTGLTGADAANYILSGTGNTNGTITVTPAPLVLTLQNKTKVYGDLDPALTFTVAGLQNGESVGTALSGAGTTYSANGAGGTNLTTALTRAAGENVATSPYAITKGAGLTATANYTIQTVNNGALTITPAPLAVTGSATKVYGQPDPVLTVTSTGYKLSDTAGSVLSGVLARAPGENAGTYTITQGTLVANPNYLIAYTPGTMTISPATLTYRVGNTTNVYGTLPTIGTTVLTGVVAGDTVNPGFTVTNSLSAPVTLATNTGVGVYGAAVTSLTGASAGNYVLASTGNTNGTITVTPATLTISPLAGTKVYGSTDPALPYNFTGLTGGDTAAILTGLLGRAAGENAGAYDFTTGTLTAGPNYVLALTPPGPVFTITPKPITYAVANTTSVYGTLGTRGAATFAGVLAGDTVTGVYAPVTNSQGQAITLATNTPVGPYGVSLSGLGGASSGNYVLAATGNTPGILTITKASLAIVIDNKSRPVSTPNPVFTFTATGLVGGDTAAALVSQNPADAGPNRLALSSVANLQSDPGMYPIVSTGALANYNLTVTPGILMVIPNVQPEPPVAPGTSGGSISATGLNFTGSTATITALVSDPGVPAAAGPTGDAAATGELVRREDTNKNFNIYIEVESTGGGGTQSSVAFNGAGATEVQGGNGGRADIVSTSSFDPPSQTANDNGDELRRRTPAQPGGGR